MTSVAAVETISRPASAGHDGGRHHPAVRVRKLEHPVEAHQPSSRPDGGAQKKGGSRHGREQQEKSRGSRGGRKKKRKKEIRSMDVLIC